MVADVGDSVSPVSTRSPLGAWLQLARASNAPSVVTNALTGWTLGSTINSGIHQDWFGIVHVAAAFLCLYSGGMILNDVCDVAVDRRERPGRPIPSGAVSRTSAAVVAAILLLGGAGLLALTNVHAAIAGAALIACIVLYDLLHSYSAFSVILMGACRGLVYAGAALAAGGPHDWGNVAVCATGLALYIALVSLIARREVNPSAPRSALWGVLLPATVLWVAGFVHPASWVNAFLVALAFIGWTSACGLNLTRTPPRVKSTVQGWLAGICLVDAFFLSLLNTFVLAVIALLLQLLMQGLHRRLPGS